MAISFKVPTSPSRSVLTIDDFLGADFTNSAASVEESKSPNTVNMIRDVPGKVRKAMGYKTIKQFGGKLKSFTENYQHIIEDSIIGKTLSSITIKARQFSENSLTPSKVEVVMTDYMGTSNKTYTIPLSAFINAGENHLYASDGFYGFNNKADVIDLGPITSRATLIKRIFVIDVQYLEDLLDAEDSLYIKGQGYVGTVTYANSLYSWNITKDEQTWEVEDAEDLTDFPITSGNIYYECGTAKQYTVTVPSWLTFTLYARQTTISCEHLISFSTYVVDEENLLQINGFHRLRGDSYGLIHAGTNIYRNNTLLYSAANDARSTSWQFEDRLYIVDGKKLLVYYTQTSGSTTTYHIAKVEDNAYIPTLTISKEPSGGGTSYEDLNLLTPAFTETFLGTAGIKDYYMSFDGLDNTAPLVWVMDSNGDFQRKTYGTDYTCNYTTGVITFTTAPGASPITGTDNVKITAYRTLSGYADRINKCTFGTLYGVNGALDRLFVSGNPNYINYDWYSQQYDPTYFADTSYSMLGSSASAIIGYSVISGYLACHKDYMEKNQNIILRQGDLSDSEPSFKIVNTLQGAGAVAKYSFAYLQTEPLFLTNLGIYAVTAQDITGEKYAQNRSYFLDGKLLEEDNLEDAFGFVYKDMYWLCLNNVAYILDGLQPIQTDKNKPYATRQYVGFYRENVPIRVMWEQDGVAYFGTSDGRICQFHTDKYSMDSYNDDGSPIEAIWETPDIDGKLFYKNKTLRYIALRLDSAIATSVSIYVMNRGLWQFIKKDDTSGRYLSFMHLIFSKLSFSGDKTQHTFATKVRVKKVDKFRLRLINDTLNEPFGLFDIAFEYVENGNYKG